MSLSNRSPMTPSPNASEPHWKLASPIDDHWTAIDPTRRIFACAVNREGDFGYPWSVRVNGNTASGVGHTFEAAKRNAWRAVSALLRDAAQDGAT